jgi:ferric-dicitrate binding protein FerR (iron transport regulator)
MTDIRTYDLFSRYASKTIRPDEWKELKILLAEADDDKLLLLMEQLWEKSGQEQNQLPAKKELDRIFTGIRKTIRRQPISTMLYRTLRVAGIFLICLLTGISVYLYHDRGQMEDMGRNEVVLTVVKGQKATITLPDGSIVHLNSESSLRYLQNYGYAERKVNLDGEAFFEVKRDTVKKFTVRTEYLNVEVLGTSFNVYAYEKENTVEMTLVSGYVKIETQTTPSHTIYVKPYEKAVYDKTTGKLHLVATDTHFDTAWMRGALVFRSEPIANVMSKIERRYGVYIHIEGEWPERDLFTGYFDSEHITDIMKILKTHYKFNYKIKGKDIWISTKK